MFVNQYAKKDWERWATFLHKDGLVYDTHGKQMKPDPAKPHPKFLHSYPKYIQEGYWEGRSNYYCLLNNDYTFHYPIHDCPHCGAREPWRMPFTRRSYMSSPPSYWDKNLQRKIQLRYDWKCAECDKKTVLDTRTGDYHYRYFMGIFPFKARSVFNAF